MIKTLMCHRGNPTPYGQLACSGSDMRLERATSMNFRGGDVRTHEGSDGRMYETVLCPCCDARVIVHTLDLTPEAEAWYNFATNWSL